MGCIFSVAGMMVTLRQSAFAVFAFGKHQRRNGRVCAMTTNQGRQAADPGDNVESDKQWTQATQ
jgi:hypothetical protein